ncbi:MAG: homoserine O-succinyltransferase [Bacteroidetes bacterium]|nr:homoserine O-succinyltransferase [Bacteroidota bacterium]
MNDPLNRSATLAILDLYNGHPNEGMRCIRQLIEAFSLGSGCSISYDIFDVRQKGEVPDLSYDLYISTGGPGSPFEGEGQEWEKKYFDWLTRLLAWNESDHDYPKKQVLFICHSFQMACRYFKVGTVNKRKSTSFGVFPVHLMPHTGNEVIFKGLTDPFYVVDSRDYQVVQPDFVQLKKIGAKILCIEKDRPHVPLERAVMAIRFNDYMVGTQFHPEADAVGMSMYLQREDKKETVIANHGFEKWKRMIEHLEDPDKILRTYHHIFHNFFSQALLPAISYAG